MRKTIVVIDGMGGGLGSQLVAKARELLGDTVEIIALATNSTAAERMLRSGADRAASGENAIRVSASLGDVVMGPIGIALPNSMLGEITPAIAEAVTSARGRLLLVPVQQSHFTLVGVEKAPMGTLIIQAVEAASALLAQGG